jgi:DNA-binding NtrC family response regulator
VEIYLPALRERVEDIPLLGEHFLKTYCTKYRKPTAKISSSAIKKLQEYPWPGNVRELQHGIERAIIMSESNILTPEDFFFLNTQHDDQSPTADSYNLEEVEKNLIQKAIEKSSGNISKAAKELGLTRASLYRRLEKHGL